MFLSKMIRSRLAVALVFSAALCGAPLFSQVLNSTFARDSRQPVDQDYTEKIRKYTTDPSFTSPLVDYLPASKTIPTPAKVLGDVSGAPDMLPYAEDVYKYFRLLEASSPRVKVFTIGHSEEGREMIAAAIADECFAWLDAPVRRVASTDTFVGYAPQLEDAILPQVDDFARAYREVAAF